MQIPKSKSGEFPVKVESKTNENGTVTLIKLTTNGPVLTPDLVAEALLHYAFLLTDANEDPEDNSELH